MKYDYLIVGSGLYAATFAHEANKRGKRCLVIERRNHTGGNAYCANIEGINVHVYGPHIFHTSDKRIWDYMNGFAEFNHYINSPIANYNGEIYNLPFNMNTFNRMWGVVTPVEALAKIAAQRENTGIIDPKTLEEQAISLVGTDIYEKLVKGYTEKQWGRPASELPAFIIKRLPLRFTYDNNYFDDPYQGIPIGGYNVIIEKMLEGIELILNTDYLKHRDELNNLCSKIIFTGMIDEYYDHCFGHLEYRSLEFLNETVETGNYQGNAVVNYTDAETPYTRIIEHKHFDFGQQPKTVITREYPAEWKPGQEPYYPVNNEKNNELFRRYRTLADLETKIIFGGRLGDYSYYNMDQVVNKALRAVEMELD